MELKLAVWEQGQGYRAVEDMRKLADRWVIRYRGRIAGLHYSTKTKFPIADPPTTTDKIIKDFVKGWEMVEALFAPAVGYNPSRLRQQRVAVSESAAFGVVISYPSFKKWFGMFAGGIETLRYAYHDHRELILRMRELNEQQVVAQMEIILAERPGFVLLAHPGQSLCSRRALPVS